MRYADTLLADGEHIVVRSRQHPLAMVLDARWALVAWGIALLGLLLAYLFKPSGSVLDIISWITLIAFVAGLVLFFVYAWRWTAQDYLITNRRILKVDGVLNKRAADSSLEKINDAVLDQNLLGRVFDYGDLDILTAADTAIDRYRMLAHAPAFKREMLNQKHALEEDLAGNLPSPPLGAAPPAAPSAATTATRLEELNALRDQGLITPAEYEAKRAELLQRL
ncbi:MAG TPA: PH domain-containing protein [Candidatus Dormibacteraeota bacterium]|nr:PH domain-containing protein [Candidatus Dormibacteraeota bacterium]